MLDRPIAAFDIETVPDPAFGRAVWKLEGDDEAVIRAMVAKRLEDTDGRTQYPRDPVHRIVAICVAWLDPARGKFRVGALGAGAWDEVSQLEAFGDMIERNAPRLVSWNGNGFDLPVIRYRAMVNRMTMPPDDYAHRYHNMHVDLMDVLSGYGASRRVGLGLMSDALGLPSKAFIDGHVYEHLLRDEEELIQEYCKLDVVSTLLVYLRWCVLRGDLDREGEDRWVEIIREALSTEAHPGWAEIVAAL